MHQKKTIWIDICHTPQAVFYIPIIHELIKREISVLITVQESEESCQLLEKAGLSFYQIGKKFGRNKLGKCIGLISRSAKLWMKLRSKKIQIGVSQGSPYQILVCFLCGIPSITIGDNEQTDWFFVKRSAKLILPDAIPDSSIKVPLKRVFKFAGLKEEVYLGDFRPQSNRLSEMNLNFRKCIVTLRSPATFAQYHNIQSEILFQKLIIHLLTFHNVQMVILPRNQKEERWIRKEFNRSSDRIVIPKRVVDGLNLIWHSDAVFSGGGTMIREAALLGVPAYSYFQGEMLAVDRYLVNEKKLKFIRSDDDIKQIVIQKRMIRPFLNKHDNVLKNIILHEILSFHKNSKPSVQ